MGLFTCIKIRLRKIKIMNYSNDIYRNYSYFYRALFDNKIKSVKQMKKILIKIIEKTYNKKIKVNEPAMMIFDKERHDINVYWNEYFMRNILKLKDIWGEPRKLCRKFKKEHRKYNRWDEYIDKFNITTESYSQLSTDKEDVYYLYSIRILDAYIIIYYNMNNKKLYTKKCKLKEEDLV